MRTKSRPARWLLATASVAVVAATVALAPLAAADPATHAATQDIADRYRASNQAPGVGVTVRNGATMWTVASGSRDVGSVSPIDADTKAHIGSLTKTFTAAIVLQLVAEGKVQLDTSVETYLPGVVDGNGYDGSKISVRQLLNHTSGIADYMTAQGGFNPLNQLGPHSLAEVASWGLAQPPLFAPGKGCQYSDTNFIIAGMIIEKITGNTYAQEVSSRITTPLGLTNTYLPTPGDRSMPAGSERGYVAQWFLGAYFWADISEIAEPSVGGSGGGLVSTGADQTKFLQALLAGQVVPQAQLAEMLTVGSIVDAASGDYLGLGIVKFQLPCGETAWGHYGLWPGYTSLVAATASGRSTFITLNVTSTAGLSGGSGSGNGGNGAVIDRREVMNTALCDRG
ncbi:beta-lactamase family protein [Solihabitans fulvus]|uniref:Beta-lactamase family protein n=1 Tax=Solihabitans fulvus TaxID=1892852 RepID=A0A5B2XVY3_9PSEU|nr:serine hydrolase domain-containing protein [Solihabitans fulvus]KAA2267160.1 beta-lactamase family protein [Solihabitans fulvus]